MHKMFFARFILINVVIALTVSQETKIVERNALLSRQKRYLTFPMDSTFVITLSLIKAIMVVQPRGYNLAGEIDVPFVLPKDTRLFKNKQRRNHYIQRREIIKGLETAFSQKVSILLHLFSDTKLCKEVGLGKACVKRMICEARYYSDSEGKSLVKDFLSAIFMSSEIDLDVRYEDSCHAKTFMECEVPFLSYILGSLSTT